MLSALFKSTPKWQSPKSRKRIEAITEFDLTQEEDASRLADMARNDSEPAVRRAAVARLTDLDALIQIHRRDLEASVREAALTRLQALLAGKTDTTPALEERLALVARLNTPQTLRYLIREAEPQAIRLAAVAQLQDELSLHEVAMQDAVAAVRQAAAERITTSALLEELANHSKQKDKRVYRIVRSKLEAQQAVARAKAAHREKAQALCVSMEAHARAALTPLYAARIESLRQQWQELTANGMPADLAERFATACQMAERQAEEQQNAARAAHELQAAVDTLEDTKTSYHGQNDFSLPALAAVIKTQRLRWELAASLHPPAPALAERYQQLLRELESLAAHLQQWQEDAPQVAAWLADESADAGTDEARMAAVEALCARYAHTAWPLPAALVTLMARQTPRSVAVSAASDGAVAAPDASARLATWLDELDTLLDQGQSRDASRLWQRIQALVREHHLHTPRLTALGKRMRELKRWAGFAVIPKKEALLARMEALAADTQMDPDDKADLITTLHAEWKALGVVEAAREQPLWDRFKAASDQAFAPCRAHFEQQRALRAANLEKRRLICEQIAAWRDRIAAQDDADIDWKAYDTILKTAREEWRCNHPVERREGARLQERFDTLLAELHARRRAHQESIAAAKRALVAQVEALKAADDLRAACDSVRTLQAQWKTLGQAHPKDERQLWQAFRAACDAVFARRQQEHAARQQARDAACREADTLLAALEAMTSADSAASRKDIDAHVARLRALSLPRAQTGAVNQRLQAVLARQEAREQELRQARLAQQVDAVLAAWQARHAGGEVAELGDIPAGWRQALQTEPAVSGSPADELLADALLDSELALDLPSPPGLEAARRARQMQRLANSGLRGKRSDATREVQAMLGIGPLSAACVTASLPRLRAIVSACLTSR